MTAADARRKLLAIAQKEFGGSIMRPIRIWQGQLTAWTWIAAIVAFVVGWKLGHVGITMMLWATIWAARMLLRFANLLSIAFLRGPLVYQHLILDASNDRDAAL
jgi:hypothetical protein